MLRCRGSPQAVPNVGEASGFRRRKGMCVWVEYGRIVATMPASKSSAHAPDGLSDIAAILGRKGAITLSSGRTSTRLTPAVLLAFREVVAHLLRGDAVAVVARRSELSTQEAADLLGLSRQHVVRLVDAGKLPVRATQAGAHRRIAATDVLRLKAKREADAAHARAIGDLFAQELARIDGDHRR